MISDPALREDELAGKTLLIVGLGRIGSRLAALASGFGMRVIATKRNPAVAVDAPALIRALQEGRIAGAALDCFWDEPLPADSPLWTFPSVLVTPHSAGETRRYEDNVIDLLLENLGRLWRGEDELKNQVV